MVTDNDRALERAAAPHTALAEAVADGKVSMTKILHAVGIKPEDPVHQAALLACDKYDLDPLLKHVIVIPGKGPYITRDGLLHVAHRHGAFDGMEVIETSETPSHWVAKVAVYRKDMGHPFTYVGRHPKSGGNSKYGPEMAVKTAEVHGLRRAFDVTGIATHEEQWRAAPDTPITPPVTAAEILAGNPQPDIEVEVIDIDDGTLFEDDAP